VDLGTVSTTLVLLVLLALAFDFMNGFHDAANSIATVVSTRVLSPGMAVVWAAFFNFIAFIVLGEAVAKTIGKDMVDIKAIPEHIQLGVLLCGLLGAIAWNLITWYYGLPSSSSHALVGGYAIAPTWGDGHHTGYYTYALLRDRCPCPECADRRGSMVGQVESVTEHDRHA
jgi:PiT family inorganic phosphate transporter